MSTETTLAIMACLITVQSVVLLMSARMLYRAHKSLFELWKQVETVLWDVRGLINSSNSSGLFVSDNIIKGNAKARGGQA